MIVKIHTTPDKKKILAVCDEKLLGQKISEEDVELDLSSQFYKGQKMDDDTYIKHLKNTYLVNAVGEKSISVLEKHNLLRKENVNHIKGIPYAQVIVSDG